MFIKWISNIIVALNSNISRSQLAAGIAWGFLLALVPGGNLIWILLFLLLFLSKANYGLAMIVVAILKLLAALYSPLLDSLGWAILTAPALQGGLTALYNLPIAPLSRFNNSIVSGGLAAGLALWLPVFFLSSALVGIYRKKLAPKLADSKLVKAFLKIPLIKAIASTTASLTRMLRAAE